MNSFPDPSTLTDREDARQVLKLVLAQRKHNLCPESQLVYYAVICLYNKGIATRSCNPELFRIKIKKLFENDNP